MPNQLQYSLKTQFSFCVSDKKLSCILSEIANQGININGYEQSVFPTKRNFNMVRLVPGTTESQTKDDYYTVIAILRDFGVCFNQKKVIQILDLPAGVPGQINTIFGALWCKVDVFSIYIGENDSLYLDVSDNHKAICKLSQDPIKQCPKNC
ncbi:hypothetical protein ABE41_006910 [Fictibacillus arsenicus]|uniref:ACT domain-containing protein n=1 Tax=Fictibacillus arsenicus TaxID=255247 RepID=A0A1B1Z2V8_9BACL|nr:hypothetical protein [Fictibacillus arsenicus]ANX11734.1 hypothetical protein ABE41_006910 [Fictibacillus arsenicus]